MKKILFIVLLMVSCADVTSPEKNQQFISSKEAVILTYSQFVDHTEFVRDSYQITPGHKFSCGIAMVDVFPSPESLQTERMKEFAKNKMNNQHVVLLSFDGGLTTLVSGDDGGGGTYQSAISKFPFVYTATKYNGRDSTHLTIDSIDGSLNIFLKIGDKPFTLNRGDSLIVDDTVYGGNPPDCIDRIFIIIKLTNAGLDSLPNDKYRSYF